MAHTKLGSEFYELVLFRYEGSYGDQKLGSGVGERLCDGKSGNGMNLFNKISKKRDELTIAGLESRRDEYTSNNKPGNGVWGEHGGKEVMTRFGKKFNFLLEMDHSGVLVA
jgi:hypothetical protein